MSAQHKDHHPGHNLHSDRLIPVDTSFSLFSACWQAGSHFASKASAVYVL